MWEKLDGSDYLKAHIWLPLSFQQFLPYLRRLVLLEKPSSLLELPGAILL